MSACKDLVQDIADHGFRADVNPTLQLHTSVRENPEAMKVITKFYDYLRDIDRRLRDRAKTALEGDQTSEPTFPMKSLVAAILITFALCCSSPAAIVISRAPVLAVPIYSAPVQFRPMTGRWILMNRPYAIGQALFGPVWVFVPDPQNQQIPQQLPPNVGTPTAPR